jgi:subtilase family serine protease
MDYVKKKIGVGFVLLFVVGISLFILKPVKNKISDRNIASAPGHQTTPEEYKSIRPAVHLHHYAVTGVPEGYTPAQIRNAYQIGQSLGTGAGQTIALIEAMGNPNIQSDLDIFCAQFQIPSTTVQVYYSQGSPSVIDPVWALETSLDVEWAHAIAPAANIMVVVAQAGIVDDLLGAVDQAVSLGANEISMSWGAAEFPTETQLDYHFDISKAIFFASAGDGGAGVSWPAASTQVNAVGGTTLYLDNSGNLTSPEVGWANGGGGQSVYEIETNYQNVVQN